MSTVEPLGHVTSVEVDAGGRHRGVCSCGWLGWWRRKGPSELLGGRALADAVRHVDGGDLPEAPAEPARVAEVTAPKQERKRKPKGFIRACELPSCGAHFRARAAHAKYCSPAHRAQAAYDRNHRKHGVGLAERRPCVVCGAGFQPDVQHHGARYCSDRCRHRAAYPVRRERLGFKPREVSS